MQRIIIKISKLGKDNWALIYRFIKSFQGDHLFGEDDFNKLREEASLKITNKTLDKDANSDNGEDLTFNKLSNSTEIVFSIIYEKQNDSKDFSDLVPFFLLKQEFGNKITLGIDVKNLSTKSIKSKKGKYYISGEQLNYVFKCSEFLRFMIYEKPYLGERNIYFINVKTADKNTGEIKNYSKDNVTSLAGKGKPTDEKLSSDNTISQSLSKVSRRYLPLLKINGINFEEFFGQNNLVTEEAKYIEESIKKITDDLKKKKFPIDNEKFNSIFEEWFIKAYFYSLEKIFEDIGNKEYEGWKNVLHSYCNNIFELVQNIIFYANSDGLMYFVFNKKENIPDSQKENILNFDRYDDNQRFVEIGIFDYSNEGIVSKYLTEAKNKKEKEPDIYRDWVEDLQNINLKSFFDLNCVLTTGVSRPMLRYAANLGLKSFANSVLKNNGYFRVESNHKNKKHEIKSIVQNKSDRSIPDEIILGEVTEKENSDGTHYEIILPVKSKAIPYSTGTQIRPQHENLSELLKNPPEIIKELDFKELIDDFSRIALSKDQQTEKIVEIGEKIIKTQGKTIALNVSKFKNITDSFVYKLLTYVQLHLEIPYENLILTHISDHLLNDICSQIDNHLLNDGSQVGNTVIWNNTAPVILISDKMRFQIFCGEKKDDFLYINNQIQLKYPNYNYFSKYGTPSTSSEFKEIAPKLVNHFYEFEIENDGKSLFEQYIIKILKQLIENDDIGYLTSHKYTRIGSKLIVKNYYEADSMFQSSFFAERFAFLIAKQIIDSKSLFKKNKNGREIFIDNILGNGVLIGYKPYSELLIKSIKELLNAYCKGKIKGDFISNIISINEEDNGDIKWRNVESNIIENPNNYYVITVVPIGSTLTSNDKILALFKQHIKERRENSKLPDIESPHFIYNHCAIVVRDKVKDVIQDIEEEQGWKKISIKDKSITWNWLKDNDDDDMNVHFSVHIGAKDGNNWFSRLDKAFFPKQEWWKEEYVNDTHNSSLNSQNLMGYPRVLNIDKIQYETECKRLNELKDNIWFGHIEVHKSHFRYYIDTESYIRRKPELFRKWLEEIKNSDIFKKETLNVLITPNINIQSDFVETIKKELFADSALIINIDVNNWRNNIVHKFSYLQEIRKGGTTVNFHYIDHALLTSETYKKAKSYMRSILNDFKNFHFESIITLINRLSDDRNEEIKQDVRNIFTFLNLFIPPSKDPERDCSLCELDRHYDKLKDNTVLETCTKIIAKNKQKIIVGQFDSNIGVLEEDTNIPITQNLITKERMFNRMQYTHKLFYLISNISANKTIEIEEKESQIMRLLDEKYKGEEIQDDIDNKISFLKVISSPPLSQYIKMRNYATRKLLDELKNIFLTTSYNFDTTCVLRVILKQLSFLKSNALVRRDVITKAWDLYYKCKLEIEKDIKQLKKEEEQIEKLKTEIIEKKQQKLELENKLKEAEEIENKKTATPSLIPTNQTIEKLRKDIAKNESDINTLEQQKDDCKTEKDLDNALSRLRFQLEERENINFQSKFQFYIKNVAHNDEAKSMFLGELLRQGEEYNPPIFTKTNPKNTLFSKTFNKSPEEITDYKEFLVWLFYDNTTIIRKTLDNFEKELDKDKTLSSNFPKKTNENSKDNVEVLALLFDNFQINKKPIIDAFEKLVKKEYYYSNFRNYLNNGDKINFVEKLLYVLFAKRTLNHFNQKGYPTNIEADAKLLLKIFSSIMDTDAALFAMKKEKLKNDEIDPIKEVYILSDYGLKDGKLDPLTNNTEYYTSRILKQIDETYYHYFPYPIIHKNIENTKEKELGNFNRLNLLLIENEEEKNEEEKKGSHPLGAITFLYNDNTDWDEFQVRSKEHGRLLLLLKNELSKYVNNLNKKMFDLWVGKAESDRKFEKIYLDSDHSFGNYEIRDKIDFDSLRPTILISMYRAYFSHTNQIVNHIYSNIEQRKELTLFDSELPYSIKIKDIFDDKFLGLIKKGFRKKGDDTHYWKGELTVDKSVSDNAETTFHKQILRAFVIQCIDNAMYEKHLQSRNKNISLSITDDCIIIKNDFTGTIKEKIEYEKNKFHNIRNNIQNLKCYNYSCMTLTALQGYCKKFNFDCDYDYDENNNFIVTIYLKNKHYE
jgi:hypothetical protein